MNKDPVFDGVVIVVIGGILLLLLSTPIKDIMNPPEAKLAAQYNENVCPTNLYFQSGEDKTIRFSVKLKNVGDDGDLFVTLFSEELLSRSSE
ncbi:MAG: hypothetical protein DRP06_03445 [Candidatus Aenigmatarchaeota archaeon]|nr:MAG: hypothetical protein DRP06_03445 [Candidatus Aenigmarchaeota archaeon]